MRIEQKDIEWLKFPIEVVKLQLAPYMETPPGEHPFIMQHHWRGRSVHVDWRMAVNGHLVGWTVLDNPKGTPKVETFEEAIKASKSVPFKFKSTSLNIGRRAETKARQPKVWMQMKGVIKKGDPGATEHGPGVLYPFEKGKVYYGAQKPYFHEYFVKSSTGRFFPKGKWFRIVVRAVQVKVLDPETKKPKKGVEIMWRALIPSDQVAYALKRGLKKQWKPPKGQIPVPPDQRKGELWERWKAFMKGRTPEEKSDTCVGCAKWGDCPRRFKGETKADTCACGGFLPKAILSGENLDRILEGLPFGEYKDFNDCVRKNKHKKNPKRYCGFIKHKVEGQLSSSRFSLALRSWMGQIVVRGIPKRTYYLRIDDKGEGSVRSFFSNYNPMVTSSVAFTEEGRKNRKWLDFEGDVKPGHEYNPNKKIKAKFTTLAKGTVSIEKIEKGYKLVFKSKGFSGKYSFIHEEPKSKFWTLTKGEKT